MSKILITRGERQGQQFVANFCACYGDSYREYFSFEPLIKIEQKSVDPNYDQYDALLVTSQNAITHDVQDRQIFHIGMKGIYDAQDLVRFVKSQDPNYKYLYLRGEDIRFDLKAHLDSSGYYVDEVVTYQACAARDFSESFLSNVEACPSDIITFFSARTAQIFMKLSQEKLFLKSMNNIKVLCISEAVLECVHSKFFKDVRVAQKPTARAMMDLIKECIDEHVEQTSTD